MVEGWPTSVPFRNLSEASNSLAELEGLLKGWQDGTIYWKTLSSQELKELELERNQQIRDGEVEPDQPRARRSDYGTKRSRSKHDDRQKQRRPKKRISPDVVDSSDEGNRHESAEPEADDTGNAL